MRCTLTNRTIGMTSFSIGTNRTINWYQWTIGLTNRIRLCILEMCVCVYKLINLHAENRLLYFILIMLLCLNSTFLFFALIYPSLLYFSLYFTLLYFTLLTFVKLEPGESIRRKKDDQRKFIWKLSAGVYRDTILEAKPFSFNLHSYRPQVIGEMRSKTFKTNARSHVNG